MTTTAGEPRTGTGPDVAHRPVAGWLSSARHALDRPLTSYYLLLGASILFALVIWFVLWELIGRAQLSMIIPPFSSVVAAGITIVPTEKFAKAVSISLRGSEMPACR